MTDDIRRQVLIKNLPYNIDDAALSQWCSEFGEVTKCSLKRDKSGKSRGFAFVTFATLDGHDNIMSQAPHYCQGRPLFVKTAYDSTYPSENQVNLSPDPLSQAMPPIFTSENSNSIPMDESYNYDNGDDNRLVTLRDELEANLECMQIAHEHEIKILKDRLEREKKLLKEAQELYKEAEEDWRKAKDENIRLRTSLIKNVVQTFNIRRDLARRTKEQFKECAKIEKQCQDIQPNRNKSTGNETIKNEKK